MSLFWILVLIVVAVWLLRKSSSGNPTAKPAVRRDGRTITFERKSQTVAGKSGHSRTGRAEFVIGGGEETAGYRIPPRQSRPKSKNEPSSSPRWEVTFEQPRNRFLDDARRFADRDHGEVDPIPLKTYWTTYDDLDRNQARWYFYWRAKAREHELLETDLSYIFIHIYECLHQIGFSSPREAFDHLLWLWKAHRQHHPNLDNYLQRWALEMIPYYGIEAEPLDVTWRLMAEGIAFNDRHLARAAWTRNKEFEQITMPVLASLFGFDPRTGKFYKEHEDQDLITDHFRQAFKILDSYYVETSGSGLFESLQLKREHVIKGEAFSGAVFELERRRVVVATVPAFSESEKTNALLEGSLKLAENLLRRKVGFGGSRRGIELPKDLESYLKNALERRELPRKPSPRREISIDTGRLDKLREESEKIRQVLVPQMAVPISKRFAIPSGTPAGHLTDVDQVADLLDGLEQAELRLLHEARSQGWELDESGLEHAEAAAKVNAASQAHLRESLLAHEPGVVVVADDYRDELEFLLERDEYRHREPQRLTTGNGHIPDEWSELKEHLTLLHLQVLGRVCEGCAQTELDSFAVEHFSMGSLLLEEINEKAMETVGDMIIDSDAEPLVIHDEHLGNVRALLA